MLLDPWGQWELLVRWELVLSASALLEFVYFPLAIKEVVAEEATVGSEDLVQEDYYCFAEPAAVLADFAADADRLVDHFADYFF